MKDVSFKNMFSLEKVVAECEALKVPEKTLHMLLKHPV